MQNKRISTPALLLGIYISFVLVRFLLALLTSAYPVVNIDEFLYYGMARSIANGEGLMFRGQQADYSYIFYSLVLVPVYLLGLKGPALFRIMQLWNILLITLSVFPIYGIAKKCVGDKKKALWLTGISMLLPDFQLGQMIMSENVIIPLFFTLYWLIFRNTGTEKNLNTLLIGLVGGLLFSTKPGTVIPAAVFLILFFISGIIKKEPKRILKAGIGTAVLLIVSAFFFLLVRKLSGKASLLSIYGSQVANAGHLNVFFRFVGVYILYIFIASGFGCIFLLGKKICNFTDENKFPLTVILISLFLMIIGVSWSVNRHEFISTVAHMRYFGMYIPLIFIISMIPVKDPIKESKKISKIPPFAIIFTLVFTVLLIILGIYGGISDRTIVSENMSLASLVLLFRNNAPQLPLNLLIWILFMAFLYSLLHKNVRMYERYMVLVMPVWMIINCFPSYLRSYSSTSFNYASDAKKLLETIPQNKDLLYIFTNEYKAFYYGALDAYNPKEISFVTMNDVFNHLYETKGVYVPFLPTEMRGNIPVQDLPETDTFFMDDTVYKMLKLSDNTEHTAFMEDGLHLVRVLDAKERWLDWIIGTTTDYTLKSGDTGIFLLFDEDLLKSPITFRIKLNSERDAEFSMNSSRELKSVKLEPGINEFEITFQKPEDAFNFKTENSNLRFYSCEIVNE